MLTIDTMRLVSVPSVSFFCVYILLTLLIGLPTFYVEFALGQFSSRSAIHVWKFAPIFAGKRNGLHPQCEPNVFPKFSQM